MSNSYRIRTTPGVDKSIRVKFDQDFESLEILSLKILQDDVYTRRCSDYGVLVGRVSINNGFGVPNAKVSIFVPLNGDDELNNPIIADLYPYKTLTQLNGDGFRYNLLPQEPSYSNHVPTGSFYTRDEVLTNPTKIEIYDKYYKYNAITNESGDYMILGVPLGSQTIVVNVDLSDIGEFSLAPQDLIRMGAATPQQVDGTKFKSSSNLNELPQIITINRTLEVLPFWGDENTCVVGITRTDFDLSSEKNITIQPTAIFMGSIISSNNDHPVKLKCKPSLKSGTLCGLVAGPGEIQAIRQTINTDVNGRPALEVASLENGGQVIDENGTWMFDVPMNLDYVVTNEFGEQVISKDPKKGIPTKGKYRFKVMWSQSPDLGERIKRANFLVPNIKEYGWTTSSGLDPMTGRPVGSRSSFGTADNPCTYDSTVPVTNNGFAAKASYAFSLDWEDYGQKTTAGVITPLGQQMILEAINCEDRFYEMQYNKVYTVSQLISEYRRGDSNNRIVAIKNILDDVCDSTNNRFPTNDGMYRLDILFLLFQLIMNIFHPILFMVIIIAHIFFWVLCNVILPIMKFLKNVVCGLSNAICRLKDACFLGVCPFGFLSGICNKLSSACDALTDAVESLTDKCKNSFISLPNLTYPDCEICSCDPQPPVSGKPDSGNAISSFNTNEGSNSAFADILNGGSYGGPVVKNTQNLDLTQKSGYFGPGIVDDSVMISGWYSETPKSYRSKGQTIDLPSDAPGADQDVKTVGHYKSISTDLPWHERWNLFNVKAKYFDNGPANPGGGVNRIGVRFNSPMNGGPLTSDGNGNLQGQYHLDNVIAVLVDQSQSADFAVGKMMTFVDPELSKDTNLTRVVPANDFGTKSITGSTIGTPYNGDPKINSTTVDVYYANPNGTSGSNLKGTYTITGESENSYHKFPMDLEYYQVIENISVSDYTTEAGGLNPNLPNSFLTRVINAGYKIHYMLGSAWRLPGGATGYASGKYVYGGNNRSGDRGIGPIREYVKNSNSMKIVFMVRGVDPNSPKTTISYDLSYLFGRNRFGSVIRTIDKMRMNIPIQGGFKCVQHNAIPTNTSVDTTYSNLGLFYDTYMWKPANNNNGVPVSKDPATATEFNANGDPTNGSDYNPVESDPNYRAPGWCDFKPFTDATGHTFYSYTDNNFFGAVSTSFTDGNFFKQTPKGVAVDNDNTYSRNFNVRPITWSYFWDCNGPGGIQIPGSCDAYSVPYNSWKYDCGFVDFKNYQADNGTITQNIDSKENYGYFVNEIVEGGNMPYLWAWPVFNGNYYGGGTLWGFKPFENCGNEGCSYSVAFDVKLLRDARYLSWTYNKSNALTLNFAGLGVNGRQIVMRADRLPSSSTPEYGADNISYTLMANNNFSFFIIGDDGSVVSLDSGGGSEGVGGAGESAAANAESKCADLLSTFSCEGLIPLDCYYYDKPNNTVTFWPKKDPIPSDSPNNVRNQQGCYGNGLTGDGTFGKQPESIMEGGCYRLVTKAFGTLNLDLFTLLPEWKSRMIVTFAACRNVFSHYFTNNWINGTLYAFSFVNSRRFTSPVDDDPKKRNKPYNCFCKNNIYFNTDSNNFYYRSSPYSVTNGFVGRKSPVNWFTGNNFGGNRKSLMYPTTIMDLGPRDIYTQEIVFSDDYDGYVMKQMKTSTFQDVSDLLNVFIITRITNRPFIQRMIAGGGVLGYFSRENLKIDGDYAQTISINSEIGVDGFDADNYDTCDIYYNGGDVKDGVFGIFYSTDTQTRDYLTPKRTIISDETTFNNTGCAFEYFKVNTQTVPFYQWNVKKNFPPNKDGEDPSPASVVAQSPPDSIFGSQNNDWSTEPYSGLTFFSHNYQKLDRLEKNSRYFRTNGGGLLTKYYRANIWSVDNSGNQSGNVQFWDLNNSPTPATAKTERVINTGAPFYFYFGLFQGKSAFDRFSKKWIESEVLTD